jgi:hypothetical protein
VVKANPDWGLWLVGALLALDSLALFAVMVSTR